MIPKKSSAVGKTNKTSRSKKANNTNVSQRKGKKNPQQQHLLKRGTGKPVKSQKLNTKSQNQRILQKTIVGHKAKKILPTKVPRLFRMDQVTGLPMDYERTVNYVMHYVNPHLKNKRSPEQMLEEHITEMFAVLVKNQKLPGFSCPTSRCFIRDKLMNQLSGRNATTSNSSLAKVQRDRNIKLTEFHTACKRGPRMMSESHINSRKSKFNKLNPYKL